MGQDEGVQLCEFRNVKIGATAVLGFALLIVVSAATFMREESLPPNSNPEPGMEEIALFKLKGLKKMPFMTVVSPDLIQPNGSSPIHAAHVGGKLHAGVWIHIIDSDGKLLFLKRTMALKTCPGFWGFLGEHTHPDETPQQMAERALMEEVGLDSSHIQLSTNMTHGPVMYYRKYPDGRIDDQLTWLWLVALKGKGTETPLKFDDEVAESKWMGIGEAQRWVKQTPSDFCHETVSTLIKRGLAFLEPCANAPRSARAWRECLASSQPS